MVMIVSNTVRQSRLVYKILFSLISGFVNLVNMERKFSIIRLNYVTFDFFLILILSFKKLIKNKTLKKTN